MSAVYYAKRNQQKNISLKKCLLINISTLTDFYMRAVKRNHFTVANTEEIN